MLTRGQIKRYLLPDLNVGGLRRWIAYQPLALLLAILMLPSLSWMGGDHTGLFQARAQLSSCTSTTNSIIQNYCTTPVGNQLGANFQTDLMQLESDAVSSYLAVHNLPATDAHVIYDYGRADLRNAIRGHIISILLGIITTPASSRTAHQQALYQWLQSLVWVNEIADYTDAYGEFLSWQFDPCHYTLDPVIASQYGITYNGAYFCGVSESSVFDVVIPAPSYFKAVGQKRSYQAWTGNLICPLNAVGVQDQSCKFTFQDTTINMNEVAGIAAAAGSIVAGAGSAALFASLFSAFDAGIFAGGSASSNALWVISGFAAAESGATALAFAGPVIAVILSIAVGVTAGVTAFDYQQSLNDLNNLKNQVTTVTNTPPDLNGMATDTSGLGLFKIENTIMPQTFKTNADGTLVDIPSTAPLPAHRPGTDLDFERVSDSTSYSTLPYKGWNGESWSAQTWGGWFVQTCANGTKIDSTADGTCIQADSMSGDLHYIDSRFEGTLNPSLGLPVLSLSRFSAARFGTTFFATRAAGKLISQLAPPGNTLNTCPVYPQNQVSLDTDGTCWSYVDFQLPIVAADGTNQTIMLTNLLSPTFTSPTVMAFGPGIPSTPTITVTGYPLPAVCIVSSTLPANFTISGSPSYAWMGTNNCSNSSGVSGSFGTVSVQLAFDGLLTAPVGTYYLKLMATNNLGGANIHAVQQTFTINVTPQLSIISPNTMNVTSGVPASFTVVATGVPTPSLTVDGVDLGGMTFTDNHNGTATIAGIDSNTVNITSCFVSGGSGGLACAIVATNSQGTYRQPFIVNLTPAPEAQLVCNGCSTTFIAGAANQLLLRSTGATTPVSWAFGGYYPGPPYPWLSLQDNGDGTAVLSGSPPLGAVGTYNIPVYPAAQYSIVYMGSQYTINVVGTPVFTNPNTATFTVGTSGAFGISANTGTISSSALPNGLSFLSGSTPGCQQCLASISGSPAAGTGGQYGITLNDDAGTAGTAAQTLTLNVNEAPKITSAAIATMFVGMPGSFAVTTTGFPSVSDHVIPANALPPTDPSKGQGMFFTVSGLPNDLQASNLTSGGFATGTLTIQGTPSAADVGTHQVQVTTQNGVGANVQTLSLHVIPYNPTAAVSLLSVWALSRDASNNVIASVVVANSGSQTAQNVSITSAAIGSVAGVFPSAAASIAGGSSATFQIQFPGASLGASGSPNVLSLSGTYTGGSFNNAGRIVLP